MVALVLAGLILWANTDSGRARIAGMATAAAAASGIDLKLEGIEGRLPYSLAAQHLSLADDQGVWLDIRDLRFSWNPWAVVSGRVRVHEMMAGELTLERLPDPGPEAAEPEPGEWPVKLLERLRIESVEFPRIHLADPVLGQAVTFSVMGQFGVREADTRVARLSVTGLDGHKTSLAASGVWRPATRKLGLEIRGRAEPDGVVTGLVGVASGESVDLALVGDGPLDDWTGVLEARAGPASADLDVRIRRSLQEAIRPGGETTRGSPSLTLKLAGRVDAADLLAGRVPEPVASLAAGGVDLGVTLAQQSSGSVALRDGLLESRTMAIDFDGALDRDDGSMDVRVRIRQPEGAEVMLGESALIGLDAELRASGPWTRPRMRIDASLSSFLAADASVRGLDLHGEFDWPAGNAGGDLDGPLSISARASGLAWSLPGMERLVRGPAEIEASGAIQDGSRIELDVLSVILPDASIEGTLQADLAGKSLTAPLEIELLDLDALDPLVGVDLEGRGRLLVDVDLPSFDGNLKPLSAVRCPMPCSECLLPEH